MIHRHLALALTLVFASCLSAQQRQLSGRVLDTRGQMLPARVYLQNLSTKRHFIVKSQSPNGTAISYNKQRAGGKSSEVHTTLSAHPFRARVPAGKYQITVERGKEYHPVTKTVELDTDASIELQLARWIDMAKQGWYSGDTHVHRTLQELPNLVMAEDLNVALPLTNWVTKAYVPPTKGNRSLAKVTPQLISVDATHVIYPVNTEYEIFTVNGKRQTQGAVFVLNHQRPLTLGAPPVVPIAKEARRQGALLDLDKHTWPWSLMVVPLMKVDLFELANNHVWRTPFGFPAWTIEAKADYQKIETTPQGWTEWGWIDSGFQTYYALLNCGFRMRPTGGTGAGVHPVPLGFGRVYVKLKNGFRYQDWIKGLDAGRSFVTTGPMLMLQFNDQQHGHRFQLPAGSSPLCSIRGTAESRVPLSKIEVIANGELVASIKPKNERTPQGGFRTLLNESIRLRGSSWVVVRCFERHEKRIRFAHTSPVYYDVQDQPIRPSKAEAGHLVEMMRRQLERNKNHLRNDELQEYKTALEIYQRIARTARD